MRLARVALVALLLAAVARADAQRRPMGGGGRPPRGQQQQRAQLEDDVRREFGRIVRERVGLNDDQMQKLGPLTRKYEQQRRETQTDERNARIRLQAALLDDNAADSTKVNQLVGQLLDIQRKRVNIAEAEQKELGTIMTAHQRARFLGVQEQIRRRLEQMRPFDVPPGGPPMDPGAPGAELPQDSAFVRFIVTPIRGSMTVDGVPIGSGRSRVRLAAGMHRVDYAASGCENATDSVRVDRAPAMERTVSKTLTCK